MKQKQNIHPLLLFGFFMNSISLIVQHSLTSALGCFLQGAAVSTLIIGFLYQINALKKFKEWKQKHIFK